mgnify:CR=1 FL=1
MRYDFKRVDLDKELRADSDGRPVFRECLEHEILLSFYDDDGAYAFETWWTLEGSQVFANWIVRNHPELVKRLVEIK